MEVTDEEEKKIRQAFTDFREAMRVRNSMNVRVASRVTAILRVGMLSLGGVSIILLFMLVAFTSKMGEMIVALNTMNQQFTSMAQDMTTMRKTLAVMQGNISHVPEITQATIDIGSTVGVMRGEIDRMGGTIGSLNFEVGGIGEKMNGITWQIRTLDPAVSRMGYDVNRMSGPMRAFNIFNPMR